MDAETAIGGSDGRFPETSHTCLQRLRLDDPEAREVLARAYWKPVYRYLRYKWHLSNEDAKDVTQGFFAHALTSDTFARWDPEQAAFRTFVRLCADRYAARQHQFANRQKRAAASVEPLSDTLPDGRLPPDEYFAREWSRQLFAIAAEELRTGCIARGRTHVYRAFEMYDLADAEARPSYADIAQALGVPITQVTNYIAAARRDLRRLVLAQLRRQTASEQEYRAEARSVLGIDL